MKKKTDELCKVHGTPLEIYSGMKLCGLNTSSGECTPPPPPPPPYIELRWAKVEMSAALMWGNGRKATGAKPHHRPPNGDWGATIALFDDGSAVAFTVESLGAGCETCGHGGGMAPPEFWIGVPKK